jgi:hypothetical protein
LKPLRETVTPGSEGAGGETPPRPPDTVRPSIRRRACGGKLVETRSADRGAADEPTTCRARSSSVAWAWSASSSLFGPPTSGASSRPPRAPFRCPRQAHLSGQGAALLFFPISNHVARRACAAEVCSVLRFEPSATTGPVASLSWSVGFYIRPSRRYLFRVVVLERSLEDRRVDQAQDVLAGAQSRCLDHVEVAGRCLRVGEGVVGLEGALGRLLAD